MRCENAKAAIEDSRNGTWLLLLSWFGKPWQEHLKLELFVEKPSSQTVGVGSEESSRKCFGLCYVRHTKVTSLLPCFSEERSLPLLFLELQH